MIIADAELLSSRSAERVRHVVCTADGNYIQHFAVMLQSFVQSNEPSRYHFFLLSHSLAPAVEQSINAFASEIGLKLSILDVASSIPMLGAAKVTKHISIAAYFRFFIPEVLPKSIERVLYLDVDLLVLQPVDALFDIDLQGYSVAAVPDEEGDSYFEYHELKSSKDYFNSGLLVIDLDLWRSSEVSQRSLTYMREYPERIHCWDQCAMNGILKGEYYHLARRWNVQGENSASGRRTLRSFEDAAIVHFTGAIKPWYFICEHPAMHLYWHYLKLTPWKDYKPPDKTVINQLKKMVPRSMRSRMRSVAAKLG